MLLVLNQPPTVPPKMTTAPQSKTMVTTTKPMICCALVNTEAMMCGSNGTVPGTIRLRGGTWSNWLSEDDDEEKEREDATIIQPVVASQVTSVHYWRERVCS